MTKGFRNNRMLHVTGLIAFFLVMVSGFISCQKKIDPEADHIMGVFHGTDCGHNPTPNVMIRVSEDEKSLVLAIPIGLGKCTKTVDITGAIDGVKVTFAEQKYTDKCGDTLVASGFGQISGHAYNHLIKIKGIVSGKLDSTYNCFQGSK